MISVLSVGVVHYLYSIPQQADCRQSLAQASGTGQSAVEISQRDVMKELFDDLRVDLLSPLGQDDDIARMDGLDILWCNVAQTTSDPDPDRCEDAMGDGREGEHP